jgi:hypothetical protein
VAFSVVAGTLIVYVNGEAVFTTANPAVVVTPQIGVPALQISSAIVSAAAYTEQTINAANMAGLGLAAKTFALVNIPWDHFYSASASLRPVVSATQAWADTGTLPTAPLTPSVQAAGLVTSGDFGQPVVPAILTGILPAPTAV